MDALLKECITHPDDIGAALTLLCAAGALCALGLGVQKRALRAERNLPLWAGGLLVVAGGAACLYAASAYAQSTFIGVVFAMTLMLANLVFAPLVNGEVLHGRVAVRTTVALCGCLLTASTAAKCEGHKDVDTTGAAVFGGLSGGVALLCLFVIVFDLAKKSRCSERGLRTAYPVFAGVTFAASVVTARAIAMQSQIIAMAALIVGLSAMGIAALTVALSRYGSLTVVPIFACSAMTASLGGGALLFSEFYAFTVMERISFAMGSVLEFAGCYELVQVDEPGYKGLQAGEPDEESAPISS